MNNTVDTIIRQRRSVYPKNFISGEIIKDNIIEKILENATWAPTHKLTQPWNFIVFKGKGVEKFFKKQAEIYTQTTPSEGITPAKLQKYEDKAKQVSHVIAVVAKHDKKESIPQIEEIVATSCAIQNIYLSMKEHGIAGYLSTGNVCYTKQMEEFLEIDEGDKILGFLQLGIAKEDLKDYPRKRISAKEKTIWIKE